MTTRRRGSALAVLATALCLSVASPAPATADSRWFGDRVLDTRLPADVTRVTVQHHAQVTVRIRHRDLRFDSGAPGAVRVAFDTGARYVGPEFYVRVHYQSDEAPDLRLARGWGALHGAPTACVGERVSVSAARDVTRFTVPARCLGDPLRLRVHVRIDPRPGDPRAADVAPGARRMGPWVNR
ncbi:MAG: hypothetical protein QOI54_1754 [Actinomycetota bacterium]|nr:hypothetical protein [Actinomycetota bacterium]